MSPLDLNAIPNPPNSPIEKLLPDTMWENIEPHVRGVLSENPTKDEILRAFSYYDRVLADYIQRHEQAMVHWANIHTHSGFGQGGIPWDAETAVIVAHTGERQSGSDCVAKAFGGYGQVLWTSTGEFQMSPGAYGSPDGMLYSWGSDGGSAIDAGFFRLTDPANSAAWEWVAMTPAATPNNSSTAVQGGWHTYYDSVRNRLHLFGSGNGTGGSGPQWLYLDLDTETVTDVGWALPLRGVAEIRRGDDDIIYVVASTNSSATDCYLYKVNLDTEVVAQHPTTISYFNRGYRSLVYLNDDKTDLLVVAAGQGGFRWLTGDETSLSVLRSPAATTNHEYYLWQNPNDLSKFYAWGYDSVDRLGAFDVSDLSTPEWSHLFGRSSNDRASVPLVGTAASDRVLSGTYHGYVQLWNLPDKQDGPIWESDEALVTVGTSPPVGALGIVQEFSG